MSDPEPRDQASTDIAKAGCGCLILAAVIGLYFLAAQIWPVMYQWAHFKG